MMQCEFENRVGFEVTACEYKKIEKMYVSKEFGNHDKDAFCKSWVENGGIGEILKARMDGNIELPRVKRYTNEELMVLVVEQVKKMGEYKKAEGILDYFLPENYEITTLNNCEFDFRAAARFGGSEGIYLDCWITGEFDSSGDNHCRMGTFKTLNRDLDSMKIIAELGGILNFFLVKFINCNIESFIPDNVRKSMAMHRARQQYSEWATCNAK